MSELPKIAVVEDNAAQRMILSRLLDSEYRVQAFESGMAFLDSTDSFDAILLDIEMPGIDGYETCRQWRERLGCDGIPIIFVSAHDTAPERMAAYEAGGDDFVTKPIAAKELRHKLTGIIEHRRQLRDLAAQSSSALTTMGDLEGIIEFLRQSASCTSYDAIAGLLIKAMSNAGLRGAVQVRGSNGLLNTTSDGRLSPLQTSVLATLRDIGRTFEMGSRAIINYEHASLLVENLPTQDPAKVNRLREHLTVLVESADMRIAGLDASNDRSAQKSGIHGALAELRDTLRRLTEHSQKNRSSGQIHLMEALELLSRTLGTLGLTESQQSYVDDLIKCTLDDTQHYFDETAGLETEFSDVLRHLESLATAG